LQNAAYIIDEQLIFNELKLLFVSQQALY